MNVSERIREKGEKRRVGVKVEGEDKTKREREREREKSLLVAPLEFSSGDVDAQSCFLNTWPVG